MLQRAAVFVLVTLTLLALGAAANGAPQTGKAKRETNPDVIEVCQYRLTMDKMEKLATTYQDIYKMMAAHPELQKESDDSQTLDQKVKFLDTHYPQATALLRSNGFSTREYLVASMALFSDVMLVGMKKQGAIKEYPTDGITPENAAFVEKNYDKLSALAKQMSPPAPKDKDDDK